MSQCYPVDLQSFEPLLKAQLEQAVKANVRVPLVLEGERAWAAQIALQLQQNFEFTDVLWVSELSSNELPADTIPTKNAFQYLGQEFNVVVFDVHSGFDPDAFGALAGTVRGGGLFILMVPELDRLTELNDLFAERMTIWPYAAKQVGVRFLSRLAGHIKQAEIVGQLVQAQGFRPATDFAPNLAAVSPELKSELKSELKPELTSEFEPCATRDQHNAVVAIEHVVQGHRRRPLVLTSDRGRGKSAALGIAAAKLFLQGKQHIIVTAPSLKTALPAFEHARRLLPGALFAAGELVYQQAKMVFVSPDSLCQDQHLTELLMVDEAAAIPVPMLQQMLNRHSRVVFSTTVHGYEGTGRGFALRFYSVLDAITPGWLSMTLTSPIRWADSDPLEQWVFNLLLLNAQPVNEADIVDLDLEQCHFEVLDRDRLMADEKRLQQLFGLLVIAHYQTRPRDLRYLLDGLDLQVYVLKFKEYIVATALVETEGKLDAHTAEQVYQNRRRVQGHLLAQTMETFVGLKGASQLKYMRIVRIAVHPACTRRGLASKLLQKIDTQAKQMGVELLGANFGATDDLMKFWKSNGYFPVHAGFKRNASSGTYAVTVIKSLEENANPVFTKSRKKFTQRFPLMLAEPYAEMEPELAIELLLQLDPIDITLSADEYQDVESFANTLRAYDVVSIPLWKLAVSQLQHNCVLDRKQKLVLILKVLQKRDWRWVATKMGLTGRAELVQLLRQTTRQCLNDYSA